MSNQNPQIIPMLSYEDGIAAMEWLCKVFGFSERTRMLDENGILMPVQPRITRVRKVIILNPGKITPLFFQTWKMEVPDYGTGLKIRKVTVGCLFKNNFGREF